MIQWTKWYLFEILTVVLWSLNRNSSVFGITGGNFIDISPEQKQFSEFLKMKLTTFLSKCHIFCLRGSLHRKISSRAEILPGRQGWKMLRLHEIFQFGLKLKSEVNLGGNSSVALVILQFTSSHVCQSSFQPGLEFVSVIIWNFLAQVAQPGLKLSSCNCMLRFSQGWAEISDRDEKFHVISRSYLTLSYIHVLRRFGCRWLFS